MSDIWTPQQRRAIETIDRNLLVSAAAGSGKTAVLAARCVHLVCDAPEPCNADELLVVTFTVAAAEEMRKRIGQRLSARARDSADPRLMHQPLLLAAAQIGTIHGLCSSIIRRNFHLLGIDPAFRLLDEDEAKLLRRDLVDTLVEERLENETDDAFRRLVEQYAGGSPRRIAETVLGLWTKLSSLIDPQDWLAERRRRIEEASGKPVRESMLGKAMLAILESRRATLQSAADRLAHALKTTPGLSGYATVVHQIAAAVHEWKSVLEIRPFDQIADIVRSTTFDRLPNTKDSPEKAMFKPRIDTLRGHVKAFSQGVFCFTEQELLSGAGETLWAIDQLTSLVQTFDTRYSAAKKLAGNLDFSDLERLALRIIRDESTGQPTPVALDYRRQFKHVLVDEYQDVNELQDTLLSLLARDDQGNLFCVGDVKQSIYRFRQADPARFLSRSERYRSNAAAGEVIDLQQNFRSRGPLLQSLNRMFELLMTTESAEVNYDESQRLIPGASFPSENLMFTGSPIELHVIEEPDRAGPASEYDADEREAVLIAHRIRALVGGNGEAPKMVAERDGTARPIQPGDIAILLRTMRIKAERYAAILRRAGIPVQADSTTGFFESTEIRDLLCTLRVIDNERSDYDLAGYLRSPLCALDGVDDLLAGVRLAYPPRDVAWFHEAVHCYVRQKSGDPIARALRASLDQLARWRAIARERPVADVVWQILSDTVYPAFCAGLPDGEQRIANLLDLHKRARAFERFRRPTLSRFLHYLSNLEDQSDLGMPSVTADGQNAVRILSIHKSKGLEFPVVIVPDLGKTHNLRDATEKVIVDDTVGLGLRIVDLNKEVHYPSMASAIGQHEVRRRALAEELRVLYVAGTRAREHLILIGTACAGDAEQWDDAWPDLHGPLPAGEVLAGQSILDWVGQAAAIAEQRFAGSFDRQIHTSVAIDEMGKSLLDGPKRDVEVHPLADLHPLRDAPARSSRVNAVIQRVTYVYPFEQFSNYPAVATVTALTKDGRLAPGWGSTAGRGNVAFEPVLRLPRTLEESVAPIAADIGAATHTVLQLLDFSGPCDDVDLAWQINTFVARRFLRPDQARLVDCAAVQWFVQTELGQLFKSHAHALRREFDLTYSLPAPGASEDCDDKIMVRGRLDAVLVEDAGLTVVDYKTDRVNNDTLDARVEFYRAQIDAYRTQLQLVTKRPVKAAFLVFLTPRRVVPMM